MGKRRRKITLDKLTVKLLGGEERLMQDEALRRRLRLVLRIARIELYPVTARLEIDEEEEDFVIAIDQVKKIVPYYSKHLRPVCPMWYYYVDEDR